MKNNIFFVAEDYNISKFAAKQVAQFFSMRIFDSIEMFEFDHAPRSLDEVIKQFGRDYVKKEMCSIAKMQLDFDEAVFVADMQFLDAYSLIFNKIKQHNLVVYLSDNTKSEKNKESIIQRLNFLADCCDLAINVSCLPKDKIFDKVILEIKNFYGLEE